MDRRDFVRLGVAGVAWTGVGGVWPPPGGSAVALVCHPRDPVVASEPVRRAVTELRRRLDRAGYVVRMVESLEQVASGDRSVVVCGPGYMAAAVAGGREAALRAVPESFVVGSVRVDGHERVLAHGADARGLSYAVLDLADRVRPDIPFRSLSNDGAPQEPAHAVRSVMRQYTSHLLDTGWLHDRDAWRDYLRMLATHRFNRLHLAFGLGYDSLRGVTDSYLLFLYPFLVAVPGYDVRVTGLSNAERDRNLETLRFIAAETVATGLEFQLGIWTHGFELMASPQAEWQVQGLTPETHAPYCRDALATVLRACPEVSSVALRIHGESGVAEGSYDFWSMVMDGVVRAGRIVEIDLHAKGIDATMLGRALATGMPVSVAPKYAAEHLGMPYHQAAIREAEMPVEGRVGRGLMTFSEGSRSFTRYGYADLLREDRDYRVRPRVFSGTQRILAAGDPVWAAAASRSFGFCGMDGVDLMEPLTCRGRRGTGTGRRDGYIEDPWPPNRDWEKYDPWYRAWGRTLYDPSVPIDVFARAFGEGQSARSLADALGVASRILPLVTTAYLPSAACDAYWPEVYWNQPMVGPPERDPYFDTADPATFQHASPLDPQLFSTMAEFAGELLDGSVGARISPAEVAAWLDEFAREAEAGATGVTDSASSLVRWTALDVRLLSGLGRFFASKLRAGVLYALYEQTRDTRALAEAVSRYRSARGAWAGVVELAAGVYQDDLSASDRFDERGQWADRLDEIDADIAQMAALPDPASHAMDERVPPAIAVAISTPERPRVACSHEPLAGFSPGNALTVGIMVEAPATSPSVRLMYRHVDQAERWASSDMVVEGGVHRADIPAEYTDSPFPLQYYFEVRDAEGRAALYPGFGPDLSGTPYFAVRPAPEG